MIGFGQQTEQTGCISGDCENGYGTYVFNTEYPDPIMRYKGKFNKSRFNGEGTLSLGNGDGGASWQEIIKGIWRDDNLDSLIIHTDDYRDENTGEITKYRGGYNVVFRPRSNSLVQSAPSPYNSYPRTKTFLAIDFVFIKSGFGTLTTTNYSYPVENWLNGSVWAIQEERLGFPGNKEVDFGTESYIGEWEDNQKNGRGTYIYLNGYIYDGEWKDDKRNGKGLMIYNNGAIQEGLWINGKLIAKY